MSYVLSDRPLYTNRRDMAEYNQVILDDLNVSACPAGTEPVGEDDCTVAKIQNSWAAWNGAEAGSVPNCKSLPNWLSGWTRANVMDRNCFPASLNNTLPNYAAAGWTPVKELDSDYDPPGLLVLSLPCGGGARRSGSRRPSILQHQPQTECAER